MSHSYIDYGTLRGLEKTTAVEMLEIGYETITSEYTIHGDVPDGSYIEFMSEGVPYFLIGSIVLIDNKPIFHLNRDGVDYIGYIGSVMVEQLVDARTAFKVHGALVLEITSIRSIRIFKD